MLRILIADDHPLFAWGLSRLVSKLDEDVETVEAGDFPEAVRIAREKAPFDLILTDLRMPGMREFEGVRALRNAAPSVPIVVVTGFESRTSLERCLESGAQGFLPKSSQPSVMMNAIRVVLLGEIYVPPSLFSSKPESAETTLTRGMDGRSLREMHPNIQRLTRRQLGVLALIGQGLSNRDIAENLNISEGTVKVHVGAILKTLGVSNRTRAALLVTELGLPREEPEEAEKVMARPAHP